MNTRTRLDKLERVSRQCRFCGVPLCCPKCHAPDDIPDYSERLLKRLEAHLVAEAVHEDRTTSEDTLGGRK
jgi:hypothetical protein